VYVYFFFSLRFSTPPGLSLRNLGLLYVFTQDRRLSLRPPFLSQDLP